MFWLWFFIAFIALGFICDLIFASVLFEKAFKPKRKHQYFDESYLKDRFIAGNFKPVKEWYESLKPEEVWLTSFDGLKLYGRFFSCPQATRTVILVHGYSSISNRMLELGDFYYHKLQCNVLLIDLRAHGKSEGTYIGLGYYESKDLTQWVEWVEAHHPSDIVLHGFSMGAATVMSVSDHPFKHVILIVEDCGYSSAAHELNYKTKVEAKLPGLIAYPLLTLICRIKAGYWLGYCRPLDHVSQALYPIIFIHGDQDKFVDVKCAATLAEACHSPKELLIVAGAAHTMSYKMATETYQNLIEQTLKKVEKKQ